MNNMLYLYFGLFGLGIGLIVSFFTIREILDMHRMNIGHTSSTQKEGLVEISGKTGDKTINSPMTKKACVLWQIDIQKWQNARHGGGSYHTIHKDVSYESFDIYDETGKIQILHGASTDLMLKNSQAQYQVKGNAFSSDVKEKLEKFGVKTTDLLGVPWKMKVIERFILAGENIYVMGNIKYADGIRTIIPVMISDRSKKEILSKLYQRVRYNVFAGVLYFGLLGHVLFSNDPKIVGLGNNVSLELFLIFFFCYFLVLYIFYPALD